MKTPNAIKPKTRIKRVKIINGKLTKNQKSLMKVFKSIFYMSRGVRAINKFASLSNQ